MNTHDINPRRGRHPTPTPSLSHVYLHLPPQGYGAVYPPSHNLITVPHFTRTFSTLHDDSRRTHELVKTRDQNMFTRFWFALGIWNAYKDIDDGTLKLFAPFSYTPLKYVRSFNLTLINIKRTTANTQGYILILKLIYYNRIYSGLETILSDTIWSKTRESFSGLINFKPLLK